MTDKNAIHLIEFTVENYRSIRDRVTFSLASTPLHDKSATFQVLSNKKNLLTSVILYGANASGKSNLMRAIFLFWHSIVGQNANFEQEETTPFLLDDSSRTKDSTFEAVFEYNDRTYIYGFQYSSKEDRISKEWLKASKQGSQKLSLVFERIGDELEVSSSMPVSEHGVSRSFSKQILPKELFLTTISKLSVWTLAKDVVEAWQNCHVINTLMHDPIGDVANMIYAQPETKKFLLPILQEADMSVADVRVTKNDANQLTIELAHVYQTKGSSKTIWFNIMHQESAGTMKFFSFALPLALSLRDGTLMVLDELGNILHPDLLRYVVMLFNDEERNPKHAQLILTTHDTTLMKDLLARDQIYFTRKNHEQVTSLYSLSDIKGVKKGAKNLDERYLNGDFGSTPDIIRV